MPELNLHSNEILLQCRHTMFHIIINNTLLVAINMGLHLLQLKLWYTETSDYPIRFKFRYRLPTITDQSYQRVQHPNWTSRWSRELSKLYMGSEISHIDHLYWSQERYLKVDPSLKFKVCLLNSTPPPILPIEKKIHILHTDPRSWKKILMHQTEQSFCKIWKSTDYQDLTGRTIMTPSTIFCYFLQ